MRWDFDETLELTEEDITNKNHAWFDISRYKIGGNNTIFVYDYKW